MTVQADPAAGATSASRSHEPTDEYPRPDLREVGRPRRFEYSRPVIDAHTHYFAPEFVELVVREGGRYGADISGPDEEGRYVVRALGMGHGAGYYPYPGSPLSKELTDAEWQLDRMAERDVDIHAVSMTHPKVYWAPPDFALRLSQAQNNGVSALHQRYPDRFFGQIMLPLQDPHLAIEELDRASGLPGLHGINIGQHVNGRNISDQMFWPIWERAEKLGQPLVLHNIDPLAPDRLYQGGIDLMNVLGNPFEATLAPLSLIVSGTLDAFPDLEIFLPHAGGALAFLIWRTDYAMSNGWFSWLSQQRASDYLRRFYYDLILHSPGQMRTLIDVVGADRLACGTDWPQGMAVWRPVEYVESIPGISSAEAELILCETPAKLIGLSRGSDATEA